MSIRRKSCEPCYRARRRCNLGYPICSRCSAGGKSCHYAYPPQLGSSSLMDEETSAQSRTETATAAVAFSAHDRRSSFHHRKSVSRQHRQAPAVRLDIGPRHKTVIPYALDLSSIDLLQPLKGCDDNWTWVLYQIRDLPLAFAQHAETIFIHRALYGEDGTLPRPLRAAFGICAASATLNDRTRPVLFRALDDEVSELLRFRPAAVKAGSGYAHTLLEDLVRLQAAVLYQIIRLFQGGVEQRVVAKRQEFIVRSYGLTLLRRADAELYNSSSSAEGEGEQTEQCWEAWLLGESIRRTVFVAFKLYTIYSHFRDGICAEAEALTMLPMSSARPGSWRSREAYHACLSPPQQRKRHASPLDIVPYGDFVQQWEVQPRSDLDAFEKLALVGCKGLDRFETLIESSHRSVAVE